MRFIKKTDILFFLIFVGVGAAVYFGLDYRDKNKVRAVIQCGHRTTVKKICFNSDSSIFAAYDEEGLIKLWDLKKGRLIKTLGFMQKSGDLIAFDNNGCLVFKREESLYLIDPDKEKIKWVRKPLYLKTNCRLSRDGKTAVSIRKKNSSKNTGRINLYTVSIWNIHDDKLINEFMIKAPTGLLCTISFNGKYAAFESIADKSRIIELYDLTNGLFLKKGVISGAAWIEDNGKGPVCFSKERALSRDGHLYARYDETLKDITVYDTSNFQIAGRLTPDELITIGSVNIYFSSNGEFLFAKGYPHLWTECWKVGDWQKILRNNDDSALPQIFISPDSGYTLFTNSFSGGFYRRYEGYEIVIKDNHQGTSLTIDDSSWIHRLAVSADGNYLAVTGEPEQVIDYYSLITGRLLWKIDNWGRLDSLDRINSMSISGNGKYLSIRTNEGKVCIWDVSERALILQYNAETSSSSTGIALSNNGIYLAVGSSKETVIINIRDNSIFKTIPVPKEKPYFHVVSLQFSADDRFIAIGISNRFEWRWNKKERQQSIERESQIEIRDLKKGKIITTLKGFMDDHYPFGFNSACDAFMAGDKIFSLPGGKFLYSYKTVTDLIKKGRSDFWTGSDIALAFGIKNVAKAWCKRDGIKIIDSKTGDIKATLYSFSDSRLAVTPEGFFSGDGDFIRRVHFIKNNRLCESNQFYDVFYRPDLGLAQK